MLLKASQERLSRSTPSSILFYPSISEQDSSPEVGLHLASLGDSSGNDGCGSGSESKLEKPSDVITSGGETLEEVASTSDEGSISSRAIGERVTDGPETDGTTTGIQQVLQHDVLDVLLANRSGAKHGESGLHQKDEGSGKKEEEGVNTILNTGHSLFGEKIGGKKF